MNETIIDTIKYCQKTNDKYLELGDQGILENDLAEKSIILRHLLKCTHIHVLFLYSNKLKTLSFLRTFTNLRTLHLEDNKIKELKGIEILPNLRKLNLRNNQIQDITPLIPLLTRPKNKLRIVWTDTDHIQTGQINLFGNPITIPPVEIVTQGNNAVLNYFKDLIEQGTEYLYEAKMLIVGQPRAGKTSLRLKLLNNKLPLPTEDKTTRGIDIEQMQFPIKDENRKNLKFKYNVWDFGGQQIYQTTHQFFLTHRSLYLLVIDTGNDSLGNDDSTVNYWLQAVELLGGNSPLLLVKNEKNERVVNIDLPQKRARFDFLKKDYSIDLNALIPNTQAFNEDRLKEFKILKDDIENELKHLPLVGFPLPKNWVKIRNRLKDISIETPYITKEKFLTICQDFDLINYAKQMELSQLFHDLGVFLHFQNYYALEDFIILRNMWATDAVFAVLDCKKVEDSKGRFTDKDLSEIWGPKGYPALVHKKLLALMMQFELCYIVDNSKENVYIVPELLLDKPPDNHSWKSNRDLNLYYRYDFMPHGLLTRLIVRLNRYIFINDGIQSVWKTGLKIDGNFLACPSSFCEITESWDNKQLFLRAQGPSSKDLLSKLTYEIDRLNDEYFKKFSNTENKQRSRWYKMIPCNCKTCLAIDVKHYYDYNDLLDRRDYGKSSIECQKKPYLTVSIKQLIDGIFSVSKKNSKPNTNNNVKAGKNIFISYSHKDKPWLTKFESHLASLKNQKLIQSWTDKEIQHGLWDKKIEQALNKADIFVLLITPNFISSNYITTKEITIAYQLFKKKKVKIIPVVCDACDWELQPVTTKEKEFHPILKKKLNIWLGQFLALPENGKPIKNWASINSGFLNVINQLKNHL